MASFKRRVMGIAVISAGVCAALPFRTESPDAPTEPQAVGEIQRTGPSQGELTLQLTIPAAPVAVPPKVSEQPPSTVAGAEPFPLPQELRRGDLQVPPQLAPSFEPFIPTIPTAREEAARPSKREAADRLHRIIDGDTLEALAERYLDSRSRWRAIFDANRDRLANPDILPIGEEIKIPSKVKPSAEDEDGLAPIPRGELEISNSE
ncbi:MAG: LysM peptidoglycan-binding domain-containing protein [Pirellulaceae bacterium]